MLEPSLTIAKNPFEKSSLILLVLLQIFDVDTREPVAGYPTFAKSRSPIRWTDR